jgi:hypothetical protein
LKKSRPKAAKNRIYPRVRFIFVSKPAILHFVIPANAGIQSFYKAFTCKREVYPLSAKFKDLAGQNYRRLDNEITAS